MLHCNPLQLFHVKKTHSVEDVDRKFRLLKALSIELLVFNGLLLTVSLASHLWLISCILSLHSAALFYHLKSIQKKKHLFGVCHGLNGLYFAFGMLINCCFIGTPNVTLDWFYIVPVIATVTTGFEGLMLYGILSGTGLILFLTKLFVPIASISAQMAPVLSCVHPIFIFLLICTLLYNLLSENKRHEMQLKEQNFRLSADKRRLHYLSHHDLLTNLPNKAYFLEQLHTLLKEGHQPPYAVTLYFMDLNDFKKINDQYGHEIGDLLLLQVSKRLQSCFRENDFIARFGGDEFTALIKHQAQDTIPSLLTKRITKEFQKSFLIKEINLSCSISIGMATYPKEAQTAEQLLVFADQSMYKNKKKFKKLRCSAATS